MPTRIVTPNGVFDAFSPDNEKGFEEAVVANAKFIFGDGRYYLDCKRIMGAKRIKINIPDAYMIDLRGNQPRLFVVENELASHDLFKHIGVQLLEFSFSYSLAPRQLKSVLFEEVSRISEVRDACERYAQERDYRNLDYLLDYLVHESGFRAIVIIDEENENLHKLVRGFAFPVEIIEFTTYQGTDGNKAFAFTPFFQDLDLSSDRPDTPGVDPAEVDTIIVPAWPESFQGTFLAEDRWYAIRIHSSMIPQIKFIAAYQTAPVSAITHVAPVSRIFPWQDSGKYCVEFSNVATEISPIKLDQSSKYPQGPRYTSKARLDGAKTLADVF